jgi:hypothetical protein
MDDSSNFNGKAWRSTRYIIQMVGHTDSSSEFTHEAMSLRGGDKKVDGLPLVLEKRRHPKSWTAFGLAYTPVKADARDDCFDCSVSLCTEYG